MFVEILDMVLESLQVPFYDNNTPHQCGVKICSCDNESDIDKKINLLYKINSLLPKQNQLNIPSLLTDDYIDTALFRIYQNMHKTEIH